jgi:nucleoside-diphosphate kinase
MALQRTLSIIKPDGVANGHLGEIIGTFEAEGLRLRALKMVRLQAAQAEGFYAEHRGKPFFEPLVAYMTSGPVVLLVLEGEEAIARNRTIMGATDPAQAAEGTLRRRFAESKTRNTVHGSDSPASAAREIVWFFSEAFEMI